MKWIEQVRLDIWITWGVKEAKVNVLKPWFKWWLLVVSNLSSRVNVSTQKWNYSFTPIFRISNWCQQNCSVMIQLRIILLKIHIKFAAKLLIHNVFMNWPTPSHLFTLRPQAQALLYLKHEFHVLSVLW